MLVSPETLSPQWKDWGRIATFEGGPHYPRATGLPYGFDTIPVNAWHGDAQFETADLSEFDAVVDVGGKLSATVGAVLDGDYGMNIAFTSNVASYGQFDFGAGQTEAMAAGAFNLDNVAGWLNGNDINIIQFVSFALGGQLIFQIRNNAGTPRVRLQFRDDVGWAVPFQQDLTPGWHRYVIYCRMATTPAANDGILALVLDEQVVYYANNVDSDLRDVRVAQFGMTATSVVAPAGAILMDSIYFGQHGTIYPLAPAALTGNFGLAVPILSDNRRYGGFTDFLNARRIQVRFQFDPNTLTMAGGDQFRILTTTSSGVGGDSLSLQVLAGAPYSLVLYYRTDAGVFTNVAPAVAITDGPQDIMVDYFASTGLNDGFVKLFLNGVLSASAFNLVNATQDCDSLFMGGYLGIDPGTYGMFFLDQIRYSAW